MVGVFLLHHNLLGGSNHNENSTLQLANEMYATYMVTFSDWIGHTECKKKKFIFAFLHPNIKSVRFFRVLVSNSFI